MALMEAAEVFASGPYRAPELWDLPSHSQLVRTKVSLPSVHLEYVLRSFGCLGCRRHPGHCLLLHFVLVPPRRLACLPTFVMLEAAARPSSGARRPP